MNKGATLLYEKVNLKKYKPKNICEVGVYYPHESNVIHFINEDISTTLIEADPLHADNLRSYFSGKDTVTIVEAAVYDHSGEIELCKQGASTFVSTLSSSPALINDRYDVISGKKFTARSILFSEIDEGSFDLLSVDIEGAEWYVVKHMISRPDIISIETHGKYYTNPNIADITGWMKANNYILWYKDNSDSIYVKEGVFEISLSEKVQLLLKDMAISFVKMKRFFRN